MTTERKTIDVSTGDGWNTGGNENLYGQRQARIHAPSLALTLQESQDVLLADGTLHVTDDRPAGVVHELDTDLRDTTTGASAAKDLNVEEHAQKALGKVEGTGDDETMDLDDSSELDGGF